MSYTYDNTSSCQFTIGDTTAATSTILYYPQNDANRTDSFSFDSSHLWQIPKPKKVTSKWLNKKLKKLGRTG